MANRIINNKKVNKESENIRIANGRGVNSTSSLGLTPKQFIAMKKLASLNSFNLSEAINWEKVNKKFFKLLCQERRSVNIYPEVKGFSGNVKLDA